MATAATAPVASVASTKDKLPTTSSEADSDQSTRSVGKQRLRWGMKTVYSKCPHCEKEGWSRVESKCTARTWKCTFLCTLVGCCCMPYFYCRDFTHTCSKCHGFLGNSSGERPR